ncbi:MAG TPA: phosphonate metabolism transcriptional regulator PhnF, partial [Candidatus Sulfotelmatobacter sp.]|nr:phosphonate metabolism transcriptional regulator PhnF [Candidatus Sulfotelmatobacter sp.]
LALRFAVNRLTLRQAIAALAERGLVRVEQGRGTFVQEQVIDYRIGRRTRFSENISRQRREPAGRLLRMVDLPASAPVARELAMRVGASVLLIETVGMVDGRPVSVGSHFFSSARVPGMKEAYQAEGSITRALQRIGVADYVRRSTRITTRPAESEEARLLHLPKNRPVLVSESVNIDAAGKPLEYGLARFAGDRVQLVVES